MDSFKGFSEVKLSDKECFYSSVKDGTTVDNGEKLKCHLKLFAMEKKFGINFT